MFRCNSLKFLPALFLVLLAGSISAQDPNDDLSNAIQAKNKTPTIGNRIDRLAQGLDLDVSAVIDGFYFYDTTDEPVAHIKEEINGFGHGHGHDHGHEHSVTEDGFNLKHVELQFSANVDPYFYAWTTIAIDEAAGAEVEEAVVRTTSLPGGFTFQVGKFFSGFGRMNGMHAHEWDFLDQPLVYELLLGDHGLNEKGAQLTWLAPTPFYLLAGIEAFNGENEMMFQQVEAEALSSRHGPRTWVGWLKVGPDLGENHGLQFGVSLAQGYHQEAHDEDEDLVDDHWLDGRTRFWGLDVVYKYNAQKAHGQGDFVLQAEYFHRKKDLEVEAHELEPDAVGRDVVSEQDGYYIQGVYGFAPRWRAGLRWEMIGLENDVETPEESAFHDTSWRAGAMVEWNLSEFSRLRLQVNRGTYAVEDDYERAWEYALQFTVIIGKHGAHNF